MAEERRFMTTPEELASAVKDRRRELHLTQAQVAQTAGVTRQFVSMVERSHPTAELGKVLAVLDAVQIHALAIPAPVASQHKNMNELDLNQHLRDYLARGWV